MATGQNPAQVHFKSDPAVLTSRARRRSRPPAVFSTLVEEFYELRTLALDRAPADAPQPDSREALLCLRVPGQRAQQLRLEPGRVLVLGRSGVSDLQLRDPALSRTHLKLEFGPRGVIATDLGSTNGSYLRGLAFNVALLQSGDVVAFGQSVLEVVRMSPRARVAA